MDYREVDAKIVLAREIAADLCFSESEIEGIKDCGNWNIDGVFWSRKIYWETEDNQGSRVGSFGVEFEPNTHNIVRQWSQ